MAIIDRSGELRQYKVAAIQTGIIFLLSVVVDVHSGLRQLFRLCNGMTNDCAVHGESNIAVNRPKARVAC